MFQQTAPIATLGVRDLRTAARFYDETLGLTRVGPDGDDGGVITYGRGHPELFVYQSTFAGTNQATAVTWADVDVDATVRALAAKGVRFEHYDDMPNMRRE